MMGDTGLMNMSNSGFFSFPQVHDYNQNVTIHISPKKVKHPSSFRRFLSSVKGKRKEKDSTIPIQDEYKPYLEDDYVKEKVTDTDLNKLVKLPTGLDKSEWLSTHTISFFEHVNLMYGTVSEYCTSTGCSTMTGPANTQYLWFDEKGKKCKCAAPQYVDYVMTFTQKTIQDESVFPSKYGNVFPSSFEDIVKKIHRYLFHVLAHIYQAHYKEILCLKLYPHLNIIFQHFMTFNREFKLLEDKEIECLEDLFVKLEGVRIGYKPEDDEKEQEKCDSQTEKVDAEKDSVAKEENKENENTEQMPKESLSQNSSS